MTLILVYPSNINKTGGHRVIWRSVAFSKVKQIILQSIHAFKAVFVTKCCDAALCRFLKNGRQTDKEHCRESSLAPLCASPGAVTLCCAALPPSTNKISCGRIKHFTTIHFFRSLASQQLHLSLKINPNFIV